MLSTSLKSPTPPGRINQDPSNLTKNLSQELENLKICAENNPSKTHEKSVKKQPLKNSLSSNFDPVLQLKISQSLNNPTGLLQNSINLRSSNTPQIFIPKQQTSQKQNTANDQDDVLPKKSEEKTNLSNCSSSNQKSSINNFYNHDRELLSESNSSRTENEMQNFNTNTSKKSLSKQKLLTKSQSTDNDHLHASTAMKTGTAIATPNIYDNISIDHTKPLLQSQSNNITKTPKTSKTNLPIMKKNLSRVLQNFATLPSIYKITGRTSKSIGHLPDEIEEEWEKHQVREEQAQAQQNLDLSQIKLKFQSKNPEIGRKLAQHDESIDDDKIRTTFEKNNQLNDDQIYLIPKSNTDVKNGKNDSSPAKFSVNDAIFRERLSTKLTMKSKIKSNSIDLAEPLVVQRSSGKVIRKYQIKFQFIFYSVSL